MNKRAWIGPLAAALAATLATGTVLADPAAPTQTSPSADAAGRFKSAYAEVSTAFTPAGAKAGLAKASQRIRRGYHEFLVVVHVESAR